LRSAKFLEYKVRLNDLKKSYKLTFEHIDGHKLEVESLKQELVIEEVSEDVIPLEYRFKFDFEDDFLRVRDEKVEVLALFDVRLKEIAAALEQRDRKEEEIITLAKDF
jgi:hypothetical protein